MSDDIPVRVWLENTIKPLLPAGWRIKPNQVDPNTIDRVTVIFKFTEFVALSEAPVGHLQCEVVLTIIDPQSDLVKAENSLDDAVLELVTALDFAKGLRWTRAAKVLAYEKYLGWDITTQIISRKKS